jgi:hypothetical protein
MILMIIDYIDHIFHVAAGVSQIGINGSFAIGTTGAMSSESGHSSSKFEVSVLSLTTGKCGGLSSFRRSFTQSMSRNLEERWFID